MLVESCGPASLDDEVVLACAFVVWVVVPDDESVAASFTRAGAGAGASLVAGVAPAVAVLGAPPLVEGAVGVAAPVSVGAAVSGADAPLSERGTG